MILRVIRWLIALSWALIIAFPAMISVASAEELPNVTEAKCRAVVACRDDRGNMYFITQASAQVTQAGGTHLVTFMDSEGREHTITPRDENRDTCVTQCLRGPV